MSSLAQILDGAHRIIKGNLVEELHAQGHSLTGALEASITAHQHGERVDVDALGYLHKLNQGVPASQIRIDSTTLAEMAQYVTLRMGLRGGAALQAAYRILQKQQQEGMPTKGSYAYSSTGERLHALDIAVDESLPAVDAHMFAALDELIIPNIKSETI